MIMNLLYTCWHNTGAHWGFYPVLRRWHFPVHESRCRHATRQQHSVRGGGLWRRAARRLPRAGPGDGRVEQLHAHSRRQPAQLYPQRTRSPRDRTGIALLFAVRSAYLRRWRPQTFRTRYVDALKLCLSLYDVQMTHYFSSEYQDFVPATISWDVCPKCTSTRFPSCKSCAPIRRKRCTTASSDRKSASAKTCPSCPSRSRSRSRNWP